MRLSCTRQGSEAGARAETDWEAHGESPRVRCGAAGHSLACLASQGPGSVPVLAREELNSTRQGVKLRVPYALTCLPRGFTSASPRFPLLPRQVVLCPGNLP